MPDQGIKRLWDAIEANLRDGLETAEQLERRAGQFKVGSPFDCVLRLSYKPSTVFHRVGKTNPKWAVITWSKDFSSHWKSCVEVWFKPESEEIYLSEFFLMNQDGVCNRGSRPDALDHPRIALLLRRTRIPSWQTFSKIPIRPRTRFMENLWFFW